MNLPQVATPTSVLPGRPERPINYVWPVTAPDGSVGYDHPLENYFDASMAPRLLSSKPPTRLYDAIACAHDHRFKVTPGMVDPSWTTPRPLILYPRERRRSLAKFPTNSTEYMGISPDLPGWRPRRSSHEDRRGAVGVAPSEVNTLVPYIPPIDTSLPPPSREWLDARAKQFLADAHADFEDSYPNATSDVTEPGPSQNTDDTDFFDYDTDSTLDGAPAVPRQPSQQLRQAESESNTHDADFNSSTDTDTDTDTDMDSDDGYNWSTTRISESSPLALGDVPRWIIPRKRPSVIIVNKNDVARVVYDSSDVGHGTSPSSGWDNPVSPPPSDDEHLGKRRRGRGKSICLSRGAKKPKRDANDTPARQGRESIGVYHTSESEEDSSSERAAIVPLPPRTPLLGGGTAPAWCPPVSAISATALQMKQVRIASPCTSSPGVLPQPDTNPVPPRPSKVFPCLLEGCTQVCASAGDLQRHQQSLRHSVPSHACLACGKSYTRSDALKRHLNSKASCKRVHATRLANNAEVEEVLTIANEDAV
ncbi:hypothetical protein J3R82DRAFT_11295 [Butyriboletus roseoflavus]|nr:hypothetical protein J3R82DRAFT_11295 [Butyriboletus roseoflavus]